MAYTFGLARENFKKVFMRNRILADGTVPGPGTYKHKEKIGSDGEKYTMRMKTSI